MGFIIIGAVFLTVLFWILIERSYGSESPWLALNGLWLGGLLGAFIAIIASAIAVSYPSNFEVYKQNPVMIKPVKDNYYSVIEHKNGGDVYYFREINAPDYITFTRPSGMISKINYIEGKDPVLYENFYRRKSPVWRFLLLNGESMIPVNDYTLEVPKGSIIYGK